MNRLLQILADKINWDELGAALTVIVVLLFVVAVVILRMVRWAFNEIKAQREETARANEAAINICTNHIDHNTEVLTELGRDFRTVGETLRDIHNHVHPPE